MLIDFNTEQAAVRTIKQNKLFCIAIFDKLLLCCLFWYLKFKSLKGYIISKCIYDLKCVELFDILSRRNAFDSSYFCYYKMLCAHNVFFFHKILIVNFQKLLLK